MINSVCGIGSTGRICADIAEEYEGNGYEVKIAYGRSKTVPPEYKKYAVRIGTGLDMYMHVIGTRLTDKHGLYSHRATRRFLKWADEYDPDILWLHNIHGYYINYELLFDWIKSRPDMQVKWTLHDCWSFTGHCAHYMYVGCDKWKVNENTSDSEYGCRCECPQVKQYPASAYGNNSANNYLRKKEAFLGVRDLSLITPCKWLKNEVANSFLSVYDVKVVYNTIDTETFRPCENDFRVRYNLSHGDKIILAVAGVWSERKGLNDLIKLGERLNNDNGVPQCRLVMVGLNSKQVREIKKINPAIICIGHTNSVSELAQIYSAADVFVNPTYEDNYPTVNLEAEACNTPVITYNTGGCAETIKDPRSMVIDRGVVSLFNALSDFFDKLVLN